LPFTSSVSSDAEVREHVLEAVVAEHRALEPRGADIDAEQVEQVVGTDRRDLVDGLALDLVGQEAGAGLADRAATPREPDAIDDPVLHPEHQRDPVATQRVGAFVRCVGILDDPEIVGPPVVLEDVVAVEVVHAHSSVARTCNSDHIRRISIRARTLGHGGWYDPRGPCRGPSRYGRTDPWQR